MVKELEYVLNKFNLTPAQRGGTPIHEVNRTIMAKLLKELNYKVGAEVGVAQGWHADMLCKENPEAKLYAIDVWDKYEGYNEYRDRIDRYYEATKKLLADKNAVIVKKFSMDAVKDFKDGELDFVYIDGAHDFKNVAMDICEWSKKVRIGGMVFGHDYKRWKAGGANVGKKYVVDVKDVVQAFMYAKGINPWFELHNGIVDPFFGRDNPAWMFIRQEKDLI